MAVGAITRNVTNHYNEDELPKIINGCNINIMCEPLAQFLSINDHWCFPFIVVTFHVSHIPCLHLSGHLDIHHYCNVLVHSHARTRGWISKGGWSTHQKCVKAHQQLIPDKSLQLVGHIQDRIVPVAHTMWFRKRIGHGSHKTWPRTQWPRRYVRLGWG